MGLLTLLFWGCALSGIVIVLGVLIWYIVAIRRTNKTDSIFEQRASM